MKNFVVMTYYQLMHATAMTLELNEKTNLYFVSNYLSVSDELIERIRQTDLFNTVVKLDQEENMGLYNEAMLKTENMTEEEIDNLGNSIFEKYLEPLYAEKFIDADFDDDIYVYNDFQRPYYYITKHFKNIIGVEDGYGSLSQQMKVHCFKGSYALVTPFIGKYYPEPLYRHNKVRKIISSCEFDDLPEYCKEKLEIIDFKELIEKNKDEFFKAQMKIFNIDNLEIEDGAVLILGTPLSRAKYSDSIENFMLYRKLVTREKASGKKIYIKPHPADSFVDYKLLEDEQVFVLPKQFPIELLEYKGIRFSKSISFGSTAVMDKLCDENKRMYNGDNDPEDIKAYIKKYVKGECIDLNIYVKLTDKSADRYINAYGFLAKRRNLNIRVRFLVENDKFEEYREYFDLSNLESRKKEFVEMQHKLGRIAYVEESKHMNKESLSNFDLEFIKVESFNDFDIYNNIISKDSFDYFLLLDDLNSGKNVLSHVYTILKSKIRLCTAFFNYTFVGKHKTARRVMLGSGNVGDYFTNQISNRLWHKSISRYIDSDCEDSVGETIEKNTDSFLNAARLLLHVNGDNYLNIKDGHGYYYDRLNEIESIELPKEQLIKRVLLLIKDYYNWAVVISPRNMKDLIKKFIESSNIGDDIKIEIQGTFIETLLNEQRTEFRRKIYREFENFNYYSNAVTKQIKSGEFDKLFKKSQNKSQNKKDKKFISRVKRKIKKICNIEN